MPMKNCAICGKEYYALDQRSVTCGKPECVAENKRRARRIRLGRNPERESPKPCAVCGKIFQPARHLQATCLAPACRKENQKRAALKSFLKKTSGAEHACKACGEQFTPQFPGQQSCGDPKCVQKLRKMSSGFVERQCKQCGKAFVVAPSSLRLYCDDKCKSAHREDQERKNCDAASNSCPFAGPWKDDKGRIWPQMGTNIPGVNWGDPIMDPMSGGFPMITFNAPSVAHEVAA